MSNIPRYAELHAHSYYSYLDGVASPEELVEAALERGVSALALTDHGGFPGVIPFTTAARAAGLPAVIGTELTCGTRADQVDPPGPHILLLCRSAEGYRRLCHVISASYLRSGDKHTTDLDLEELAAHTAGEIVVMSGCRKSHLRTALGTHNPWNIDDAHKELDRLIALFGRDNVVVELSSHVDPHMESLNDALEDIARRGGVRAAITGNVHHLSWDDLPLYQGLCAIRSRQSLEQIERHLSADGLPLRSPRQMAAIHRGRHHALEIAADIADECALDLRLITPHLPHFPVPEGHTQASWLRHLVTLGAHRRYGTRTDHPAAWAVIDKELAIIEQLDFPGYFLIVTDIVEFCRTNGIWCQGRGSAANSAVCYALGITPVDAVTHTMLFERFLSPERSGPPDIDVDIEASRREEVIQYVFTRYGRTHAAQVGTMITYRPRSALRDAAKALGYSLDESDGWIRGTEHRWAWKDDGAARESAIPEDVERLARALTEMPRHTGIHSGGIVLCEGEVSDVVPVQWGTKPGRTVVQWDKDMCADAGLVKFDLLGLGMLAAMRRAFTALHERGICDASGAIIDYHTIDQHDERVYDLLCAGDTVGVFQVESRAQIATLPRLKPRCFYDIVIEVALIRPGPIQGGSVNPYLRRRTGAEEVTYIHPLLRPALEKTLGVPLFQEQLMQIAVDAAGFSPAQADRLRRAMGSKHGRIEHLRAELHAGMAAKGISDEQAEQIYEQLQGFAQFGFPESHSFSFAYLVYASAWLKVHHPEEFYAALLASQPMGFYSPKSLVADAKRHGIAIAPIDINASYTHTIATACSNRAVHEPPRPEYASLVDAHPDRCIQIGLDYVKDLSTHAREQIVAERASHPYRDLRDVAARLQLDTHDMEALAAAGAFASFGYTRREALWHAREHSSQHRRLRDGIQDTIPGLTLSHSSPTLPPETRGEKIDGDVRATRISLGRHPCAIIRPQLHGVTPLSELRLGRNGMRVKVAGIVTHRQRPHTAQGITFLALEDETGIGNIVCMAPFWEKHRPIVARAHALIIEGILQKTDDAVAIQARAVEPLYLPGATRSRDFR